MLKAGGQPPFLKAPDFHITKPEAVRKAHAQQQSTSGYTFTDLAQMVCKVQRRPFVVEGN